MENENPFKEIKETTNHQGKSWAFTLNNYGAGDEKLLQDMEKSYIIFGREKGENGTPHLQGVVIFRKSVRFAALKKILPRAHWGATKVESAAINYCMKDQDYFIEDNRSQGKRNDLTKYTTDLKILGVKRGIEENIECALKYPNGTRFIIEELGWWPKRDWLVPPEVRWYYGEAGMGKTKTVYEEFGVENIYTKVCQKGNKWFNGYKQHKCLLLDELRSDSFDWGFLLQLLDRYPMQVETKGGTIEVNSPVIIITTPRDIEGTFSNIGEDLAQIIRRVTKIRKWTEPGTGTEVV